MLRKFCLIIIAGCYFLINTFSPAAIRAAELNLIEREELPLASFLFAHHDQMRVGWYNESFSSEIKNLRSDTQKPVGSLFVQLKPRKNEGVYQLALRVLRDGSHQYLRIREFTGGKPLNYKRYLTIPFELLIGVIQGEALRSLFPNDRVEAGGWLHQVTYVWETPELLAKSFTKSGKYIFPQEVFNQGEKFTIPWISLRSDLELEPLAVRDPLIIKKDDTGLRFAFYQIQPGDTLYSSVVIRFIGETKHFARSQNASDLLVLNGLTDARLLSPGQYIKIPLDWIRPEYLHPVPGIYRNSKETSVDTNVNNPLNLPLNDNLQRQTDNLYQTKSITQR